MGATDWQYTARRLRVPHPIPYQGSKRALAATILRHVPERVDCFIEPFAGSAAVTLAAAQGDRARRFLLGDSLAPLAGIWRQIVRSPNALASGYRALWSEQLGQERAYYDAVRDRFNRDGEPTALLYLLARCVKNAVRFNSTGAFNQSPDRRRRGTHPDRMAAAISGAHSLLRGRTDVRAGDFTKLIEQAGRRDFVYLDPPYQGTSQNRDRRYHQGLDFDRFVEALAQLRARKVSFAVSFDGRTGTRRYGRELPASLGLRRIELRAGRSTQATLHGRDAVTYESLYCSR